MFLAEKIFLIKIMSCNAKTNSGKKLAAMWKISGHMVTIDQPHKGLVFSHHLKCEALVLSQILGWSQALADLDRNSVIENSRELTPKAWEGGRQNRC